MEFPAAGDSAKGRIDGPAGALEIEIDRPEGELGGLALVCHPHPQHGGTKDNKVVFMTARALAQAGLTTLRFNFRGVGDSAGDYDAGVGEVDDAAAVAAWAVEATGESIACIAGFSFGAAVALRLADRQPPPRLITIGMPASYFDSALPRPDSRWLAIYGDADEVIDAEASRAALAELEPAVDVRIMEGAGHFLHGRLGELRRLIAGFMADA